MIIEKLNSVLYWAILGVLLLNIMQRKHAPHVEKKRTATLMIAVLILIMNVLSALILQFSLSAWMLVPSLMITAVAGFFLRSKIGVFSLSCNNCGTRLDFNNIIYRDDNLCDSCRKELHPELFEDEPAAEEQIGTEELQQQFKLAKTVEEIDWDLWEPDERAVICYIFRDDQVMLIHKKTGLGKGMVNAPGGRIEDTETAMEAAVRETQEETHITPKGLRQMGVLNFQFTDGYSLRGFVFFADDLEGVEQETDEAAPFWTAVDQIPYDQMWEDDRLWLPKALEGSTFDGKFIFDDRKMISSSLAVEEPAG